MTRKSKIIKVEFKPLQCRVCKRRYLNPFRHVCRVRRTK